MARLCNDCIFNNNGWCNKLQTNKGLKDLTGCRDKRVLEEEPVPTINKLEKYLEMKRQEIKFNDSAYNRAYIKGIEVSLAILKDES